MNKSFWKNKKVLITGNTGFKGSWLSLWLDKLGANVIGYSQSPPTKPSLFDIAEVNKIAPTTIADIRDKKRLEELVFKEKPEIIFHMAAQPLVRASYLNPVETYETNVMGTVHVLEAVRMAVNSGVKIKAVVNVTTDKCYENQEWPWAYREIERLGGYDPYSNSKACSELVTDAYRNSFFNKADYTTHGVAVATGRAGNVIGGGDWAEDRLIPDCVRTLASGGKILIRNPHAIRPWQHVLEPLSGYITLAEKLYEHGAEYADGWNFGPDQNDGKEVEWIVKTMCQLWGIKESYEVEKGNHPHEAHYLKLDCSKAKAYLNWTPRWNVTYALEKVVEWTKAYENKEDIKAVCLKQIEEYEKSLMNE